MRIGTPPGVSGVWVSPQRAHAEHRSAETIKSNDGTTSAPGGAYEDAEGEIDRRCEAADQAELEVAQECPVVLRKPS